MPLSVIVIFRTHCDHCSEFDDPTPEERKLYVQYWQNKLRPNKSISFPDDLVDEIVKMTDSFSFAYLKEVLYVFSSSQVFA